MPLPARHTLAEAVASLPVTELVIGATFLLALLMGG